MRNISMAESYLRRAQRRLRDAERALGEGFTPDAVRYSQECTEISAKAALRLVGVEYPKEHDVGDELRLFSERFPGWFRAEIPRAAEAMRALTRARGLSFYGDEERGLTPEELFSVDYAREVYEEARRLLELCLKLLDEWRAQKPR